jgi:hypothetical protein
MSETPRDVFAALLTKYGQTEIDRAAEGPYAANAKVTIALRRRLVAEHDKWLARFDAAVAASERDEQLAVFTEMLSAALAKWVAVQVADIGGGDYLVRGLPPSKPGLNLVNLAALPEADGWISVEERLPDLDIKVLALVPGWGPVVAWRAIPDHADVFEWASSDVECNDAVTHWRPLPPPPEPPK